MKRCIEFKIIITQEDLGYLSFLKNVSYDTFCDIYHKNKLTEKEFEDMKYFAGVHTFLKRIWHIANAELIWDSMIKS